MQRIILASAVALMIGIVAGAGLAQQQQQGPQAFFVGNRLGLPINPAADGMFNAKTGRYEGISTAYRMKLVPAFVLDPDKPMGIPDRSSEGRGKKPYDDTTAAMVKAVTTLDVLSGGRAWLGLGAGYLAREAEALGLPPGYDYRKGFRSRNLDEVAGNFLLAFALSLVLMYMVLAAQFESFTDPIPILLALPLTAASLSLLPLPPHMPAHAGAAGAAGPVLAEAVLGLLGRVLGPVGAGIAHLVLFGVTALLGFVALGLTPGEWRRAGKE